MLDFLGIGAQKAGTTWAYQWLAKHPALAFPLGKEAHFWNRTTLEDLPWYWEHMRRSPVGLADIRCGEITPAYALLTPARVRLIYSLFPQLRVFFIIRNPIVRAWSAALMALKRAELALEEVSDQWFVDHFQSAGSLSRGDYLRTIDTWLSVYPKEQFHVLYHDELADRPGEVLAGLAKHLGVDPSFYARFSDSELHARVAPTALQSASYLEKRPRLQRYLAGLYSDRLRALSKRIPLPPNWLPAPRDAPPLFHCASESRFNDSGCRSLHTDPARPGYRRIAVFIPVLNRGHLALASLTSLRRALGGLAADIYLFDNGSAQDTVAKLRLVDPGAPHRLAVFRLPENRGLPYAFNLFCRVLEEPCDFAGYAPPDLVMIADADVYYKRPINDLVSVLLGDDSYGAVSGHDSVEHRSLADTRIEFESSMVEVSEKLVERGQCLLLRRGDALACYPLPHDTNLDLDWQLLRRHPNSITARGKKVVAVDATVHLGVFASTWSSNTVPASAQQLREVNAALTLLGLDANTAVPPGDSPESKGNKDVSATRSAAAFIQYPVVRPRQLLVLGMHRSGTSAVAGLLARLGAHVGTSEDLLQQDVANPVGYFERADVLHLNQRLLARYAADAYQVGHLPVGVANRFDEPDLAIEARKIISRLDAQGVWVAKDPRFCLTLPFWRRAGLTAIAAIIVVRHPVEVARSLALRDRLPLPYALALWERYYVDTLNYSIGLPKVLLSYNSLMHDPTNTVDHFLRSLKRIGVRMPGSAVSALQHLDTRLHRHNRAVVAGDVGLLSRSQSLLYATLTQASIGDPQRPYQMSETSAAILREYPVACDLSTIEDEIGL